MKNKTILFFLSLSVPNIAYASDPTPVLYIMFGQVIVLVWPLLIPLLFLRPASNKLKIYFLFLIVTYGVIGLISLPINIYINIAAWTSASIHVSWSIVTVLIKNGLALLFSIWLLNKIGSRLIRAADEQVT